MTTEILMFDHGYVRLVETWGSDVRIVEAARMSTGKGFLGWGPTCAKCGMPEKGVTGYEWVAANATKRVEWDACEKRGHDFTPGDEKLLRFLYENHHDTPFEMAGAIFEIMGPIAQFREHQRHRTQGYNEFSARYGPLPDMNYVPTLERIMGTAPGCVPPSTTTNRQAGVVKGAAVLTMSNAEKFRTKLAAMYEAQEALYQEALNDGVPKELARMHIGVGRYSRMRATANLRNWLGFLKLRMAMGAQWEIRQSANAIHKILAERFPRTLDLFEIPK